MDRRNFLSASLLTTLGCGSRLAGFPFDRSTSPAKPDQIELTYYSVGCVLVRYQGIAFLTDPFWSHRPLSEVVFGPLKHDHKEIDKHRADLSEVTAILIGHGHYDHCLDLEPASASVHPTARIYASQTLKHVFAQVPLGRAIIPMNEVAATPQKSGEWQLSSCGRLRILPILSGHPNQWLFFHLWQERLNQDLTEKPIYASDFQEGITLAFLVDYLRNGEVAKRVYVQTSSTGYPAGFAPTKIFDEHPVDVAILPMDCANLKMRGAEPNLIDALKAPTIVFCHWEDFFRPKSGVPKEILKVDLPALRKFFINSPKQRFIFPLWNQRFAVG